MVKRLILVRFEDADGRQAVVPCRSAREAAKTIVRFIHGWMPEGVKQQPITATVNFNGCTLNATVYGGFIVEQESGEVRGFTLSVAMWARGECRELLEELLAEMEGGGEDG